MEMDKERSCVSPLSSLLHTVYRIMSFFCFYDRSIYRSWVELW